MGIFARIGNGWTLAMQSLAVIRENRRLILFPLLSIVSLLMILAVFAGGVYARLGFDLGRLKEMNEAGR